MRRNWIQNINAGVREHGISYSRFIHALNYNSNIEVDRKIMAGLAHAEPFSFKAIVDEVKLQAKISDFIKRKPVIDEM
jgi:large subunit ribosomal protein L20